SRDNEDLCMDGVSADLNAGTPAVSTAQTSLRAIDRIRAAFAQRSWPFELPEYPDENGKPMVWHFFPLTTADIDAALIGVKDGEITAHEKNVRILIAKARDENGQPLFNSGDFYTLMNNVPFRTLVRATDFMYACGCLSVREAEDELKNGQN